MADRRARRPRRARARAGEAGRPRLGRLDRLPALPAGAAALRALPGAEHPAALDHRCGRWSPHLWRFWYQWLILAPGIGYRAAPQRRLRPAGSWSAAPAVKEVWDEETLRAFADTLHRAGTGAGGGADVPGLQPGARCCRSCAAATREQRLTVPTRLLFGERRLRPAPGDARRLRAPRRRDGGRARPRLRPLHRRRAPGAGRRARPRVLGSLIRQGRCRVAEIRLSARYRATIPGP